MTVSQASIWGNTAASSWPCRLSLSAAGNAVIELASPHKTLIPSLKGERILPDALWREDFGLMRSGFVKEAEGETGHVSTATGLQQLAQLRLRWFAAQRCVFCRWCVREH